MLAVTSPLCVHMYLLPAETFHSLWPSLIQSDFIPPYLIHHGSRDNLFLLSFIFTWKLLFCLLLNLFFFRIYKFKSFSLSSQVMFSGSLLVHSAISLTVPHIKYWTSSLALDRAALLKHSGITHPVCLSHITGADGIDQNVFAFCRYRLTRGYFSYCQQTWPKERLQQQKCINSLPALQFWSTLSLTFAYFCFFFLPTCTYNHLSLYVYI